MVSYLISFGGSTCEVINREAQARGILHLAAGCNVARFNTAGSFSFRLAVNEQTAAEKMASYLQSQKVSRAAFIYVENTWGTGLVRHAEEAYKKVHIDIVERVPFRVDQGLDFRSSLIKIKAANPQVIFFASLPNITPHIMRQLRELKIDVPLVSNISVENPEVIRLAGAMADEIMYVGVKRDPRSPRKYPDFYQHHRSSNPFVELGFDSYQLLQLVRGTVDPRAQLYRLKDFVGTFSSYSFDSYGESHFSYQLRQIRDGAYVDVSLDE